MYEMLNQRLQQLIIEREELIKSLPAHSVPVSLVMELEELEEKIAVLQTRTDQMKN